MKETQGEFLLHITLSIIDPSMSKALRTSLVLVGMGVLGKRQKKDREGGREAGYGCSN